MTRAARTHDVIVVEEPLFDDLTSPRLDMRREPSGVTVATPFLPNDLTSAASVNAQRTLLEGLLSSLGERSRVLWYYTPMALAFSEPKKADFVVYDNMDELSAFRGASPDLLRHEDTLLQIADVIFVGGMSLFEAKRHRHRQVYAFPSSVDREHFAIARGDDHVDPENQIDIPHPRLGFFGVIDERLDLGLVAELADLRPDLHFIMLGPVVKISPDDLPLRRNIHWLGIQAYSDLPRYLAGWDVGIMPFAINESTRFISPTKTPEFLAAGLPVVSTPIVDVVRPYGEEGLVAIAGTAPAFSLAIDAALQSAVGSRRQKSDEYLAKGSWDATWLAMLGHFSEPPASLDEAGRYNDLASP